MVFGKGGVLSVTLTLLYEMLGRGVLIKLCVDEILRVSYVINHIQSNTLRKNIPL